MYQHSRIVRAVALTGIASLLALAGGCGILLPPEETTVRLVNNGTLEVRATLYYSDNQDIPRDLLTSVGNKLEFTLGPGDAQSFTRDCKNLQAVVIDDAELRVIGGIGPNASSNVLRDGSDFDCRSTITFAFEHTDVLIDFNIATDVQR